MSGDAKTQAQLLQLKTYSAKLRGRVATLEDQLLILQAENAELRDAKAGLLKDNVKLLRDLSDVYMDEGNPCGFPGRSCSVCSGKKKGTK